MHLLMCVSVLTPLSMLHSRVLGEQTQLKEEMENLRRDNGQLVREHNHLKQNCEELTRLHSQDQKELADLRLQQQQVQSTRKKMHVCVGVCCSSPDVMRVEISLWRFTDVAQMPEFHLYNLRSYNLEHQPIFPYRVLNSARVLWPVLDYFAVLALTAPMGAPQWLRAQGSQAEGNAY